jgi:ribbon-helix-helix CopG family protein
MIVLNRSEGRAFITAAIPPHLRAGLEQSARANDRSMSAVVRRALTEYLTSPLGTGSRGPAGSRTRPSQADAGGSHSGREGGAVEARARRGIEGQS